MTRRDLFILAIILLWASFVWFILPEVTHSSKEMISCFTCSMIIMMTLAIVTIILFSTVKSLSSWGYKPLFKKKVNDKKKYP